MFNKTMKKKGQLDIIFLVIFISAFAIIVLISHFIANQVTDGFRNSSIGDDPNAAIALDAADSIANKFDYIWLAIFIILLIASLISAVLIEAYQIYIPIWIILMFLSAVVGVIMNNVYADFVADSNLSVTADAHPFANFIISNYVTFIIGVAIMNMILTFSKIKSAGGRRV